MGALATMEADTTPTKGLKKDDLVGYVASVAAEKAWAPLALNLRLDIAMIEEEERSIDESKVTAEDAVAVDPVKPAQEPMAEAA